MVLEIISDTECDTGLTEEPEEQWKRSKEERMRPCNAIKHVFMRTARNCPDVIFLQHNAVEGDPESGAFCASVTDILRNAQTAANASPRPPTDPLARILSRKHGRSARVSISSTKL